MRYLKKFNENLNQESESDLIDLANELEFVNGYLIQDNGLELYELIDVVRNISKMKWDEIMAEREHLSTNYHRSAKDDFTLRIIDRYCSNVEFDD